MEQYHSASHLLAEAEGVSHDGIQDTFLRKVQCHWVKKATCGDVKSYSDPLKCRCNAVTVKALLDIHDQRQAAAETRAVELVQNGSGYAVVSARLFSCAHARRTPMQPGT